MKLVLAGRSTNGNAPDLPEERYYMFEIQGECLSPLLLYTYTLARELAQRSRVYKGERDSCPELDHIMTQTHCAK